MEKQKRWQFYVILAVVVLTLVNILPTVFFYSKPLKEPVDQQRSESVATQIIDRVNSLEADSKDWLYSFSNLLGLKPTSIELNAEDPGLFEVSFDKASEATLFSRFLPRAGSLISFVPAQLGLYSGTHFDDTKVLVTRQVNTHLNPEEKNELFHYYSKYDGEQLSEEYRDFIYDRTAQIVYGFAGPSQQGLQIAAIARNPSDASYDEITISLAREIKEFSDTFGETSPISKRFFASFNRVDQSDGLIQKFLTRVNKLKDGVIRERDPLIARQEKIEKEGSFLDSQSKQRLVFLTNQYNTLNRASQVISKNLKTFTDGKSPITDQAIRDELAKGKNSIHSKEPRQIVSLFGYNPFVEALVIDWDSDSIQTQLYADVQKIRTVDGTREEEAISKDKINHFVINDLASASRESDELFSTSGDEFAVALSNLTNTQSFLNFNLGFLAEKISDQVKKHIDSSWKPQHADLNPASYPLLTFDTFERMSPEDQKLGLVIYAPSMSENEPPAGFRETSLYVIARGMNSILQKAQNAPQAPESIQLQQEVSELANLMKEEGFIVYPGSSYGIAAKFNNDYIFELSDYYSTLLKATREDFYVKGSKRFATLDFTDVEQRIITTNKIGDQIQEDLVKWRDEYNAAQVDINTTRRYEVPKPTKNAFVQNFKLSLGKYFRGDDRKIIRWGLDLSGGKTVRIGLLDQNGIVVTNPEDVNQAVNELYTRINKMGVSERTIRIENNNIILDFPGSQALSASELVKASAMYFHIVNEKYSLKNPELQETVNQFLQNVWNEAVVTNRKDSESINQIAWEHLGGDIAGAPRSEAAKMLYDNGLRLASPQDKGKSSTFDDTLSAVAVMRGEEFSEWRGQTHPLMIVFNNFALEGSSLTNVQTAYDPSQGNILSFSVKSAYDGKKAGNPQDDFYAWTAEFSEESVAGTPKEAYSQNDGWRMAVVLNDTIITEPTLRAALREGGTISGRFTQREITQLAADLKAGSLSFTPRILSEQNVSAELGQTERTRGIAASLLGLVLVAVAMTGYYRFAGLIATCAVLFNLLIMWGVLQNLGAALTLPGLAGIVLTIGMAVDANVLVFERIREEFKISGRIASAIQAGYRKAFSAIVDSNVTTIIAALILIQFDSGPIKGFAITLIIGLLSSMFTALFMTRYFFAGWVKNPKNKILKMANLIGDTNFNFLAWSKKAISLSIILMIVGGSLFLAQRNTMFGMDFTGGYSLTVELEEEAADFPYRLNAMDSFIAHGASANDIEIRQLSRPNHLRIQLSLGMEESGHPFFEMPRVLEGENFAYAYEQDPRINWVVTSLADGGLEVQKSELVNLDKDWSMMSGQFSETMRNNALWALGLALMSILAYITIRFEFKYAVAAVIALAHDVIVTMCIYSMFHWLGFPVQIDLEVVGAIMTIIGYSLNNTIVVFDRIREDLHLFRKMKFADILNHSLNVTLSRTVMTSATTVLVLLSLVIFGGRSIFDFSLVMTIGVVVGTFSSLFIAGPVMLFFHNREVGENGKAAIRAS